MKIKFTVKCNFTPMILMLNLLGMLVVEYSLKNTCDFKLEFNSIYLIHCIGVIIGLLLYEVEG